MAETKKKITVKAVMPQPPEIGADTDGQLLSDLMSAAISSNVDLSALESFESVAQTREQTYSLIDTMCNDSTMASVVETYAEDVTQSNDNGNIVWVDSSDTRVLNYVSYLLKALDVDKHIYDWAHCLIKYGDVYLRLYRESDYEDREVFSDKQHAEAIKARRLHEDKVNEGVKVVLPKGNDPYVLYVEKVDNPSEMFELTRFGKTMGYIQVPVNLQKTANEITVSSFSNYQAYRFKKNDVKVYSALDFVHASLSDTSDRTAEEVSVFFDDTAYETNDVGASANYKVKRGKSLLANMFKTWRELSLLENSVLLSRLTRSSIVRLLQVEVGQQGKEQVQAYMQSLKSMFEQKSALRVGDGMSEYTNPGPIENIVYVPTKDGKGHISMESLGGDVDPKQLTDLSWFQDKLFGGLRVPKQFFGVTDDNAGFSGGTSLSIISSRYGKAIKRIQNVLCQLITDLINIFLLDKGLLSYVNAFTIRMQPPVTQEEIDKRADVSNRLRNINDILATLTDITSQSSKLKILKRLLSTAIVDTEIVDIIQKEIDKAEAEEAEQQEEQSEIETAPAADLGTFDNFEAEPAYEPEEQSAELPEAPTESQPSAEEPEQAEAEDELPSISDLGVDLTQNG